MKKKYKIVVVGLGYVGLSNAVLLAQHNEVTGVDISQERVNALNSRNSPIKDDELSRYLKETSLNISASTDLIASVENADYVIVATPTSYDERLNSFDTSSVETVIKNVTRSAPDACIVIKSTLPVGFTDRLNERLKTKSVIHSPEFLREGKALYDNLYPSRIIIGERSQRASEFADLLLKGAMKQDIDVLFTGSNEAEAIKLFSNTYLAMRVAFFNELDSYALRNGMSSKEIIDGVSLDPRIGNHYNNPSFGYGGYCLPKDTKQLLANYQHVPQKLIEAIVRSNTVRAEFIANEVLRENPKIIGIYRLKMKSNSDNFRNSAVFNVIRILEKKGKIIQIYEPNLKVERFAMGVVCNDLEEFKSKCDIIIANRASRNLIDVSEKIFTRDLYGRD